MLSRSKGDCPESRNLFLLSKEYYKVSPRRPSLYLQRDLQNLLLVGLMNTLVVLISLLELWATMRVSTSADFESLSHASKKMTYSSAKQPANRSAAA